MPTKSFLCFEFCFTGWLSVRVGFFLGGGAGVVLVLEFESLFEGFFSYWNGVLIPFMHYSITGMF